MPRRRTPLGSFSVLPIELRLQIWQYFLLQPPGSEFGFFPMVKDLHQLAILRVSRKINGEITSEMYANRTLVFTVSPYSDSDLDTAVSLHHPQRGNLKLLSIENSALSSSSTDRRLGHSHSRALYGAMPLYLLKAVRVEVKPPNPQEPGELIRAWEALFRIDDFLSKCDQRLAPLHLVALEHPIITWRTSNPFKRLQKHLMDIPNPGGYLGVCLVAFWHYLHLDSMELFGPKDALNVLEESLEGNLGLTCTSHKDNSKPSGHSIIIHQREKTQRTFEEDDWYKYNNVAIRTEQCLEYMLDSMAGRCAAILRLRRYLEWDHYTEEQTLQHIKYCPPAHRTKLRGALKARWAMRKWYHSHRWQYWNQVGIPPWNDQNPACQWYDAWIVNWEVVRKLDRGLERFVWEERRREQHVPGEWPGT